MAEEKFRVIEDTTSDVAFEAYAKTIDELFENAAYGLFSVICDINAVNPSKQKTFKLEAETLTALMLDWLDALIASVDIDKMFFSKFKVRVAKQSNGYVLKATAWGEPVSIEKSGTVVKGIAYYDFKLQQTEKGFKARIVCDI